ncbi:MAG: patatin-like phospholipase family protein [Anaerolineae bacterium]
MTTRNNRHHALGGPQIVWDRDPQAGRLGLVLSGGAARGIAHLGVLQVLEEHDIRPDCIAGCSAGAVVGGLYAAGVPVSELVDHARELRWREVASITRPGLGFFDFSRLEARIDEILGKPTTFADLQIPFAAVAVDIMTGELVAMNEGPLAPAIRASCSVPGIFVPVRRSGRLLVDGGVVNNLPVSVVQGMGATSTIAVDVLPAGGMRQKEPKNIVDLLFTTMYMLIRATHNEGPQADRVIMPDVGHVSMTDLSAVDELVEAGRTAAKAMIPIIKRELGSKDEKR